MTRLRLSHVLLAALLASACTDDDGFIERTCQGERCVNLPEDGGRTPEPMAGTPSDPPQPPSRDAEPADASGVSTPPAQAPGTCTVAAVTPHPKPLAIQLVIDGTAGALLWWTPLLEALNQFLWDPKSAGLNVGLTLFGAGCAPEAYEVPTVPIGAVPDHNAALLGALPMVPTTIDKAAQSALQAALTYAGRWSQQHSDTKTVAVLLMEDLNADCGTTEAGAAAAARAGYEDSIPTYAIGFAADLNAIAEAGGTGRAREAGWGEPAADALAALTAVRDAALPPSESVCRFAVPAGATFDPDDTTLHVVGLDGSETTFKALANSLACSAAVNGFYFDEAAGTLVVCDSSCGRLRGAARIELSSKCPATPKP